MKLIKDKKVFGWVMYDWANSAFATTVMAGFFPIFFKNYWSAGANVNESTFWLGIANSVASLIVALMAPILGAIADQSSGRKKFLIFFAYMGVLLTGCLFMISYGHWLLAALIYVFGTVGFSGANTFYDSLLPDVAEEKKIDYISAKGFAFGYLGGGLLFLLNVLCYLYPATFCLPVEISSTIQQKVNKDAVVIQVVEDRDFTIPEDFEKGYATVKSEFSAPIDIVTIEEGHWPNYAKIKAILPDEINVSLIDSAISFSGYKKADIVEYNSSDSTFLIKNLTRKISESDSAHFILNNRIVYTDFKNNTLLGVENLENHFGKVSVESDFLQPPIEFLSIRLSFLSVALWWAIFTIPLIVYVKERRRSKEKVVKGNYIKLGFGQLKHTFNKIRHMKVVFLFLLAYWLYIDGVDTIIRMAVDYGMSIGFPSSSLIVALLITQFVGFPSALLFGKLGEKWDVKKSIFIGIAVYLCVTIWGVMMTRVVEFYVLAIVIGLVQGGIQALSRSFYSRLIPKNQSAEFYGFYNMLGKFAAILGPVIMGSVGLLVRHAGYSANIASRTGIASISILFIAGAILLYFVDEEKGQSEVEFLRLNRGEF
ncbi:MAG: MFS transporter [Candidatus Marinimicrobia bacterium]|nr:MFS transporter [Candidatus Neomarinimicrobiota bacterium]